VTLLWTPKWCWREQFLYRNFQFHIYINCTSCILHTCILKFHSHPEITAVLCGQCHLCINLKVQCQWVWSVTTKIWRWNCWLCNLTVSVCISFCGKGYREYMYSCFCEIMCFVFPALYNTDFVFFFILTEIGIIQGTVVFFRQEWKRPFKISKQRFSKRPWVAGEPHYWSGCHLQHNFFNIFLEDVSIILMIEESLTQIKFLQLRCVVFSSLSIFMFTLFS
jgi:hypothetical protein